jgi:hypothetical protein
LLCSGILSLSKFVARKQQKNNSIFGSQNTKHPRGIIVFSSYNLENKLRQEKLKRTGQ